MKFNTVKKFNLILITTTLIACATTFNPNAGTIKHFTITTKDIAGLPSQPNTEIVITKTIQNVSNLSGKSFEQAFSHINPDLPKRNPDETLKIVNAMPKENLNNYEIALIHKYSGYAFIEKENYTKAIEQFNLALSKKDYIPISTESSILFTLSQLYTVTENRKAALECAYKHTDYLTTISDVDYAYIAALQDKTGDIKNALKNISTAINLSEKLNTVNLYHYDLQAILYKKDNQPDKAKNSISKIRELAIENKQNDIVPIVKATYEYPTEAINKKIEGYCIVNFTINSLGDTQDVTISPSKCKTKQGELTDLFSETSISAVKKFKYNPIRKNGVIINLIGMSHKFIYSLEE